MSCRRCAVKSQLGGIAQSAAHGSWGCPWGLIATPVPIVRNVVATFSAPSRHEPSDRLRAVAREHADRGENGG